MLYAKTYPCLDREPLHHCGPHAFLHWQMLAHFMDNVCIVPTGRFWVRKLGHRNKPRDGKVRANCHDGPCSFRSCVLVFSNLMVDMKTVVPGKRDALRRNIEVTHAHCTLEATAST